MPTSPPARRPKPQPLKPVRPGRFTAFVRTMWVLFGAGIVGLGLFVLAVSGNFLNLFGRMPNLKTLENPRSELASEIYSADGVLLGKYFRENRTPVEFKDLPQNLIDALIATEDVRFEQHSGIDAKSMLRAVTGVLTFSRNGGGSTLTQQVAKVLFRNPRERPQRRHPQRHRQAGPAHHQNQGVDSGHPAGAQLHQARNHPHVPQHRGVRLQRLRHQHGGQNLFQQKAQGPDHARGRHAGGHRERARAASAPWRTPTARASAATGCCARWPSPTTSPPAELAQDTAKAIVLHYSVENPSKGLAPYFRAEVVKSLLAWAKETDHDLYADGLKIYTTIDSRMQKYAEKSRGRAPDPAAEVVFGPLEGPAALARRKRQGHPRLPEQLPCAAPSATSR